MSEKSPPPRPSPSALARYAELFNQSATLRYFGVSVAFPDGEKVLVELPIKPEHLGGLGSDAVNGGVLSAMFDLVIGCTPALIDPTRRTATIQLSVSFERPVRGRLLRAEAWIDKPGNALIFSSARILDEAGMVCARCQGLIRFSEAKWASGESPAIN